MILNGCHVFNVRYLDKKQTQGHPRPSGRRFRKFVGVLVTARHLDLVRRFVGVLEPARRTQCRGTRRQTLIKVSFKAFVSASATRYDILRPFKIFGSTLQIPAFWW